MTALATPPESRSVAADLVADQVTLTVIDNYLATTCREMGIAMMRTAYSPMFNESLDFSCVLFDANGRLSAQAEFCPSQIGTIKFTVEWMLDELGPDIYRPGDVIIMNDPYRGSGHIPEHTLLKAVFHGDEIVGFVANCAHLAEPGAKAPGGLAGDATDIFQEGCAYRRCGSSVRACRRRTSGRSFSPITARRRSPTATSWPWSAR